MAEVMQRTEFSNGGKRRKGGNKKGKMANKRPRFTDKKDKVDQNLKKLYAKRAREYNSDDEDESELENAEEMTDGSEAELSNEEVKEVQHVELDDPEVSEDEEEDTEPGISKFAEGISSFGVAFKKILKKGADDDDIMGPVLSGQKNLLAEKLAEEESEKKVKGEAKKEKLLIKEKGHVKPANFLDTHEKFLLGVATKGVVKLFNAVNKAQNAQRGLNPSRFKDEKVIKKRRKDAFFSELGKKSSESSGKFVKDGASAGTSGEAPAWAPLRDDYMLTNPKLKDWDKMQDMDDADEDDFGRQSDPDSSSGDD